MDDKKSSSASMIITNCYYNIPPEIIFDILTFLPLTTLLRCKTVCKLWCKIIEDPLFVYKHSNKIKIHHDEDYYLLESCKIINNPEEEEKEHKPMRYGFLILNEIDAVWTSPKQPKTWFSSDCLPLVGSCNGLICLNEASKFQIMNPLYSITNVYEVEFPFSLPITLAGFGFDKSSKRFKIVCHDDDFMLYVHECGGSGTSSSWRQLSSSISSLDCFFRFHPNKESVFVDGTIYWLACVKYSLMGKPCQTIISFNLTTEELEINTLPMESHNFNGDGSKLFAYEGSLFLASMQLEDQKIWIWELCNVDVDDNNEQNNKDGVMRKKWIRKFCVSKACGHMKVIGFLNGCDILLKNKAGNYFSYDRQAEVINVLKLATNIRLMCHTGSLIRPCDLDASDTLQF